MFISCNLHHDSINTVVHCKNLHDVQKELANELVVILGIYKCNVDDIRGMLYTIHTHNVHVYVHVK